MEDHNKFDDYIKKTLNEEWQMPEDLQWDQMDIDIPEQKKKRRFLLWIPFFIGVGFLSILTFKLIEKTTIEQASLVTENNDRPTSEKNQEQKEISTIEQPAVTTEKESKGIAQEALQSEPKSSTKNNSTQAKINTKTISPNLRPSKEIDPIRVESSIAENAIDPMINNSSFKEEKRGIENIPMDRSEGVDTEGFLDNPVQISEENEVSVLTIISPFDKLETISVSSLDEPPFSFYPMVFGLEERGNKLMYPKPGITLKGFAGVNSLQFKIASDSPLLGKQKAAFGRSYALQVSKGMKNNFVLHTTLSYDELHTTFEHHRVANTELDYTRLVKVITCENIFHNNFTNIASISMGADRRFLVGQRFQFQIGALAAPTYILGVEGKTLEGDEVIDLANRPLDKRWYFSYGANAGISIQLHKRISLTSRYEYARYAGSGLTLDEGVTTSGLQRLQLGLSLNW